MKSCNPTVPASLLDLIVDLIRPVGDYGRGFIDLALYHPLGYYTAARQRSGRAGDFFTSVDVGPLFGEMLAAQLDEMWRLAGAPARFDLVEAAAGNGRLARDVLDAAHRDTPAFYEAAALHLVERSGPARDAQRDTLGPHAGKLAASLETMPSGLTGVIFANELLDALPVHLVVMRDDGLREVRVAEHEGALLTTEDPPSTPRSQRASSASAPAPSRLDGGSQSRRRRLGARRRAALDRGLI
jgi:SAM-dependent MidA family methyltransferase